MKRLKIPVVGVGNSGTKIVNHMIDSSVAEEIAAERLPHRVLKGYNCL